MLKANTTFDLYFAPNCPPALPNVQAAQGYMRACFAIGMQVNQAPFTFFFDSVMDTVAGTDTRDDWPADPANYTLYVPNLNGVAYRVIFTEMVRPLNGPKWRRIFIQRIRAGWPQLIAAIMSGLSALGRIGTAVISGLSAKSTAITPVVVAGVSAKDTDLTPLKLAGVSNNPLTVSSGGGTGGYGEAKVNGTSYLYRVAAVKVACCPLPVEQSLKITFTTKPTCWLTTTGTLTWNGTNWQLSLTGAGCETGKLIQLQCAGTTWTLNGGTGTPFTTAPNLVSSVCNPFMLSWTATANVTGGGALIFTITSPSTVASP
jgi:hypothetical protein